MDNYGYIPDDKNDQNYRNNSDYQYQQYQQYERGEKIPFLLNSNRLAVRIISFAAAILLVGIGFFLAGLNERRRLERENTAVYSRAFSGFAANICSIDASLEKMLYVTSPEQMFAVSSDLFRQVGLAKSDLGELPVQNADIANMQIFLAQTGDYVYSLTQKSIKSNSVDLQDNEKENINVLLNYSGKLASQLVAMQDGINKSNRNGAVLDIIQSGIESENVPQLLYFNEVEQIFSDYPKLIYDGPFSSGANGETPDKRSSGTYKMLDGEDIKEITAIQARGKAADFCGISESKLKIKGTTNTAAVSAYNFEYGNKYIQVSTRGGYVLNYLVNRKIEDQLMSDEDALRAAKKFLRNSVWYLNENNSGIELKGLKETYYVTEDGMVIINFAAVQDDITLYPDLIKVGVALDNCEIMMYEASGYLQNHTMRDLSGNIVISREKAAESVSPSLKINAANLAVIPENYDKDKEVLCYEFKCANSDGKEYIVYVNAKTGRQQDIFAIIDTGRGKFVM